MKYKVNLKIILFCAMKYKVNLKMCVIFLIYLFIIFTYI